MQLKNPLQKWQIEKYLTDHVLVVAPTIELVHQFLKRDRIEEGIVVPLQEALQNEPLPGDIYWVQAETVQELMIKKIPGLEDADPSIFTDAHLIALIHDEFHWKAIQPGSIRWRGAEVLPKLDTLPWVNPEWEKVGRIHDWRNYVSDEFKRIWDTLDIQVRRLVYLSADQQASNEEWD
uniref:RecX-like filament modulator n=1 Tax=Pseudomonas phage RVTF4 TaxID=3236931 RepID=A0AB39CDG8_9VIRU